MTTEQLRDGHVHAYRRFYSLPSMARRFPRRGSRSRTQWSIYNLFYQKGEVTGRTLKEAIAASTAPPRHVPNPRNRPVKREGREAVLEGLRESQSAQSIWDLRGALVTRRLNAGIDPRGRFGSGRRGHRERQDAAQPAAFMPRIRPPGTPAQS